MTRHAYVLGWPVKHSLSPAMFGPAFAAAHVDADMTPLAVQPDQLAGTLPALVLAETLGASVTVPHKVAIVPHLTELSIEARTIGAVNCLEFRGRDIIGHNTDGQGFADSLAAAGVSLRGKRVVLLGSGGAARAVAYGVRESRAIEVVARRYTDVRWATAWPWEDEYLRDCFARADLVVDCTSAGLEEATDVALADALPLEALAPAACVATLVYHRPTHLLERAAARGHSILDGRGMLVHQGARAFSIWTGRPAPVDVMSQALDAALAR